MAWLIQNAQNRASIAEEKVERYFFLNTLADEPLALLLTRSTVGGSRTPEELDKPSEARSVPGTGIRIRIRRGEDANVAARLERFSSFDAQW